MPKRAITIKMIQRFFMISIKLMCYTKMLKPDENRIFFSGNIAISSLDTFFQKVNQKNYPDKRRGNTLL